MARLTQAERIRHYDLEFPNGVSREGNSTLFIHNGTIYGYWVIGNLYKRNYFKNPTGYYGGFPHKFKERSFAVFPDCIKVLHFFSGTIRPNTRYRTWLASRPRVWGKHLEITYDIDRRLRPTISGDIRDFDSNRRLKKAVSGAHFILSDPMYDAPDFAKHGQTPFSKTKVLQNLGKTMKKGAFLGWLDTRLPMFNGDTWLRYAEIAVRVSTNTRMRVFLVLQKK